MGILCRAVRIVGVVGDEALGSQKKFCQKLRDRHFHKHDVTAERGFNGLRILPQEGGEATWDYR